MASDGDSGIDEARRELDRARASYYEDTAGTLAVAVRCQEAARTAGDDALLSRALSLQGAIRLHRGDLRGAFALAADAERHAECVDDVDAQAELAALKAHLSFFSGGYAEALRQAEKAVALSDRGDLPLQVFARRAACLVFGNLGIRNWHAKITELLELAIEAADPWQEAISRNDLAHFLMDAGDLEAAERMIDHAVAIAAGLERNAFALGVVSCTRADIRLRAGRAEASLEDAERAVEMLGAAGEPNPYVVAMTVVVEVRALLALGRLEDAERSGQRAIERLGERVPQARSLILGTVATALREAGRLEDAFEALARSAELERAAFLELSELQLGLERATLETRAARREAEALARKNRELEIVVRELAEAHAELERRTIQLEGLQGQLREQADRDWLTGLHNRRFLARELGRLTGEQVTGPFSLAVVDLDHFKSVNDRFGHDVGDRVLVRASALLVHGLRRDDVVVRTGGEEFVVLMPGTDAAAAERACERLRCAIREEPWDRIAPSLALTASVGVASADDAVDLESLARIADRRLYDAKHGGRDRVAA
jgi:diguanylate cyclase (GGDEF)-like protein